MMQTSAKKKLGGLDQAFQEFVANAPQDSYGELRQQAFSRFAERGIPTRRDEEWKYTSLRAISEGEFHWSTAVTRQPELVAKYSQPDELLFEFHQGQLVHKPASVPGLTVMTMAEAIAAGRPGLSEALQRANQHEHPFSELNQAFLSGGIYIEVEPNKVIDKVLHLFYGHSQEQAACFPRTVVVTGRSSQVTIVETYAGEPANTFLVNSATDFDVGENAEVRHMLQQDLGDQGVHLAVLRAQVARDGRYRSLNSGIGGQIGRVDLHVSLNGAGATTTLDGLYLTSGKQHIDNHSVVDHRVPDTNSDQVYRGILAGQSRGVFNGKVVVRQDAQRTDAQQLNRNLMLSSEAEVDTKPELAIDADDVSCSHGATIGQLSAEELFYCQTRGINADEARVMLSRAFADAVAMRTEIEDFSRRMNVALDRKFAEGVAE